VSGPVVVVDTNVFVSARNRHEAGHSSCRKFLDSIDDGSYRAIVSVVTVAELRAGISTSEVPTVWKAMLSHLHTSPHYQLEVVDSDIAELAGELRAAHRVTLPDAIVVATGQLRGASLIVTQDRELARRQSIMIAKAPQDLG
jgi:predicted nucleic acid-binding protein